MIQVTDKILKKYARLAIVNGVNIQKGQGLIIRADVNYAKFVEMATEIAYQNGARKVLVDWRDGVLNKHTYNYQSEETLKEVDPYRVALYKQVVDDKFALLSITGDIPGLLKDCDPKKIQAYQNAYDEKLEFFDEYMMGNFGQWCVVGIPNIHWAKKVFPDLAENEALEALWDAILRTVHINEENDPVKEWEEHSDTLHKHCDLLNKANFKSLHFKNEMGTDLTVGLVSNHLWDGGSCKTPDGVEFNANMPTEEVFTTPAKYGVEGVVYASKPLNHNGQMVEDFWIRFENGKAIDFDAKVGKDTLKSIIEYDMTSAYLGEVALVPFDSPISQSQILFFNTLYDENASCHLALGASYPTCLVNGTELSKEEYEKAGANNSSMHCDFMFGTSDMKVTGTTYDNKEIVIMENGNFVI